MFDNLTSGRYWDVGLSLIEGCTPIRCSGCWSATASHMRKDNPFVAHRHKDLTEKNETGIMFNGQIRIFEKELDRPRARKEPRAYQIWNDLFHYHVPESTIIKAFETFEDCQRHIFFVLTQRIERACTFLKRYYENKNRKPLENVIIGTTIRDKRDILRADYLCSTPAYARFVSVEPLRGPVSLTEYFQTKLIDSVIIGGSTGQCKDKIETEWALNLISQAKQSGVNVFFKSWGNNYPEGIAKGSRSAFGEFYNELPIKSIPGMAYKLNPIVERSI